MHAAATIATTLERLELKFVFQLNSAVPDLNGGSNWARRGGLDRGDDEAEQGGPAPPQHGPPGVPQHGPPASCTAASTALPAALGSSYALVSVEDGNSVNQSWHPSLDKPPPPATI